MESAFISKVFCTPYEAVKQFVAKNTTIMLNILLLCFTFILVIMSFFAFCIINRQMFNYEFSFSVNGIETYLSKYGGYKALFTTTVATIVAYLGLLRLKAATDANVEKVKQDRFVEWKSVLETRLIDIETVDPLMKRGFTKVRYNLFKKLYDIDFSILDKNQLKDIFDSTFKKEGLPQFFESQNLKLMSMGEIYLNEKYSYSFDSFRFIFCGCLDNSYPDLVLDLKNLYLELLPPERLIDEVGYRFALTEYRKPKNK